MLSQIASVVLTKKIDTKDAEVAKSMLNLALEAWQTQELDGRIAALEQKVVRQ